MGNTYHLITVAGIPIKVHWTFGLLVLSLLYFSFQLQMTSAQTGWFFAYMATLFLCVILHEYGHALMARRFGVRTRDIIISPIGGLARMENIPRESRKEMLIAIAGPVVNLVIVLLLFFPILLLDIPFKDELLFFPENLSEFILMVLVINIALFLFNLIPAFPMDGGRILRALLAYKFEYAKATKIAVLLGRILSLGFIVTAIYRKDPTLFIIGIFIFYMAGRELSHVQRRRHLSQTTVQKISNYNYSFLSITDTIQTAVDRNRETGERSFLIRDNQEAIIGTLPEAIISYAVNNSLVDESIASMMSDGVHTIREDLSILQAFHLMDQQDLGIVLIEDDNRNHVAVLDRNAIKKFLHSI